MKPQFALSLSFDGIRLLLRAAGGWQRVGDVDVASPSLAADLAALRAQAATLRPGRVRTKLIIPDDQIRYLSIETGALDDAARTEAARLALDGATPYPVDALVFDISADGPTTHVAAVARETLAEAEAFASEHKFNPVSFVSAPDGAGFLGEPFFGVTALSRSLVPEGKIVEPDGIRVVVVGDVVIPDAADADGDPESEGKPKTAGPDPDADAAKSSGPEAEETSKTEDTAGDADETPAEPEPAKATAQKAPAKPEEPAAVTTQQAPAPAAPEQPETEPAAAQPPKASAPAETAEPDAPEDQASDSNTEDAASEQSKAVAALGFASRRGSPITAAAPLGGVTRSAPDPDQARPTPILAPAPPAAPPKATTDSLRPTAPPPPASPPDTGADTSAARVGGFLSRRKAPAPAAQTTAKPDPSARPAAAQVEAQRMTVFGARDGAQVRGKPRFLGLILMAFLLIFLAGVAAWAAVFMDDGLARLFQGRERTLASTLPDDTQAALADDVGATSAAPDEAAADGVVVAALNDSLSDGLTAEDAAVLDALRDPLPDPPAPEELDAAALEARYAVTGIWSKAPEATVPAIIIPLEDLYITSIDPVSPALDAVALPPVTSFATDTQLASVTSPVAAGTSFARDGSGRVIPTLEGALSPDGFTVYLGRPEVVPPPTPVRFATDPTKTGSLSTLTQVRPRARPTDLVEQNERATLGGLSRSELADLRPRLRPQALQQQLEETAALQEDTTPSALAATQSLRPEVRPRNFDRVVARATRTQPSASTAAVTTASVAPRTVSPAIPSSASVTREATVRNAINLSRLNLIGVYGTPSDRRALVRLSNGRYQKVQVGDRIDGGRVSAIGDGELRYQKGNRNLVLKMPQG